MGQIPGGLSAKGNLLLKLNTVVLTASYLFADGSFSVNANMKRFVKKSTFCRLFRHLQQTAGTLNAQSLFNSRLEIVKLWHNLTPEVIPWDDSRVRLFTEEEQAANAKFHLEKGFSLRKIDVSQAKFLLIFADAFVLLQRSSLSRPVSLQKIRELVWNDGKISRIPEWYTDRKD
jgi:hypothetical protein